MPVGQRFNMTLKSSSNSGATWTPVAQLTTGPSAYSCITPVGDRKVGVVYEKGEVSPYEKIALAVLEV